MNTFNNGNDIFTIEGLNELETLFKDMVSQNPSFDFKVPRTLESLQTAIPELSTLYNKVLLTKETLPENLFIENDMDAALIKHLRYLPAQWHSHSFIEIAYVIHGCCTNYIAEQKITMNEGNICIISPDTQHALSVSSDDCIVINILIRSSTFEKSFFGVLTENDILSDFFTQMLFGSKNDPYLLFNAGRDDELLLFARHAFIEFSKNRQYRKRMLNSIIDTFFITLLRKHSSEVYVPGTEASKDDNLIFILKYMQDNFMTISVGELARFFNYSERQIQRIIKNYTGMNFTDNIKKMKMKRASMLLSNTTLPIAAIASELGYAESLSFRNAFKSHYGMTPSEFRNSFVADIS